MKKSCFLPSPGVTRCENRGWQVTHSRLFDRLQNRLIWVALCGAELILLPVLLLIWWLA